MTLTNILITHHLTVANPKAKKAETEPFEVTQNPRHGKESQTKFLPTPKTEKKRINDWP